MGHMTSCTCRGALWALTALGLCLHAHYSHLAVLDTQVSYYAGEAGL